jgi:hypothetical protein
MKIVVDHVIVDPTELTQISLRILSCVMTSGVSGLEMMCVCVCVGWWVRVVRKVATLL